MKNGVWNIFILTVVILGTFINSRAYVEKIPSGLENYIFRCRDFGQYIGEAREYTEEPLILLNTIEQDKEPLLFIIISSFKRLAGITVHEAYLLNDILIHTLSLLFGYILVYKISKKRINGLIYLLIITTSLVENLGFDALFSRQALSNFFLISWLTSMLFLSSKKPNNKKLFIISIFLGCCFIGHRISLVFSLLTILCLISYLAITKNINHIKTCVLSIALAILLSGPYLFLSFAELITYVDEKLNNYIRIASGSKEYINRTSLNTSAGASIIGGDGTLSAFKNYWYIQGFLIVLLVSKIKYLILKPKKEVFALISILIITLIYTCFKIPFSNRVLITFNLFLLIFIGSNFHYFFEKKIIKILSINLLFLIGFFTLAPKTYSINQNTNTWAMNIKDEPSVNFLKENIPLSAILIGSHCVNEFGEQLGYQTALNIGKLTIWNKKEAEEKGEIPFSSLEGKAGALTYSLFDIPYSINQFKDKQVYILFGPYFHHKKALERIKNKDPFFFNSSQIELIYENKNKQSYINYIFRVDGSKLNYFSDENYFNRTIGKYIDAGNL